MLAKISFYPLGNADTVLIDLADGRKVLVDYANMRGDDPNDKRCDLPTLLGNNLKKSSRDYFDAVCITHLDNDHCNGFGDFFWLDHAKKYQGANRIEIEELWVPAAAILEENLDGDARLVRAEARDRLRKGKGVLVFSRTDALEEWFKNEGIDISSRSHLIVDAGKTVPGYCLDEQNGVEFFVHCPFAWKQDESASLNRNEDSVVLHVTFREGGNDTRLFMGSDIGYETIEAIVKSTKNHDNEDRLKWDIMKLPHHCSYKSLGPERGVDETEPAEDVKYLFEDMRMDRATIVSPSDSIPEKGSEEDESKQPPHRQAANYYRKISRNSGGEFKVTMEHPAKTNPKPLIFEVTARGIVRKVTAASAAGTTSSYSPRAG